MHTNTHIILLQILVFLIGNCDSHFPAAEILRILILTSRNFALNTPHVHSDDVNMNLRKLNSLFKYPIHTVIDKTADTVLSHTLHGIVHLKVDVPVVVFSK